MKGLLLLASTCILWTGATAALSSTTTPSTFDPSPRDIPRLLLHNISNSFSQGSIARFSCKVPDRQENAVYTFLKQGVPVAEKIVNEYTTWPLSHEDTATYTCSVPWKHGGVVKSFNQINIFVETPSNSTVNRRPHIKVHGVKDMALYLPGEEVQLSCEGSMEQPVFAYRLYLDGGIHSQNIGSRDFYIRNVTERDSGVYACSAVGYNGIKTFSNNTVYVQVWNYPEEDPTPSKGPVSIQVDTGQTNFTVGEEAKLICRSDSIQRTDKVDLILNGIPLIAATGSGLFHIRDLQIQDTGVYTCAVRSAGVATTSHNSVYIRVTRSIPPLIVNMLLKSPSSNLTVGDFAVFTCQVNTLPQNFQYEFWHGGNRVASQYDKDYYTPALTSSDGGLYWCAVFDGDTRVKSDNRIYLAVSPNGWSINSTTNNVTTLRSTRKYNNQTASLTTVSTITGLPILKLRNPMTFYYEGATVDFTCDAPGYSTDNYFELSKNGQSLRQQKGNEFPMYSVRASDSGVYSCAILLIYRKVESGNRVYIQIRPHSGTGDRDYPSGATTLGHGCTYLITSVMLVLTGTLMGIHM